MTIYKIKRTMEIKFAWFMVKLSRKNIKLYNFINKIYIRYFFKGI